MTAQPTKSKVQELLNQIKNLEKGFLEDEPGSREQLLNVTYALASSLELPSEAIQRIGWAEVRPPHVPVRTKLMVFSQHGQLNVKLQLMLDSSNVLASMALKAHSQASLLQNAAWKWISCPGC